MRVAAAVVALLAAGALGWRLWRNERRWTAAHRRFDAALTAAMAQIEDGRSRQASADLLDAARREAAAVSDVTRTDRALMGALVLLLAASLMLFFAP